MSRRDLEAARGHLESEIVEGRQQTIRDRTIDLFLILTERGAPGQTYLRLSFEVPVGAVHTRTSGAGNCRLQRLIEVSIRSDARYPSAHTRP